MAQSVGLMVMRVDVAEGRNYAINVEGVNGPVDVHYGPNADDPVIARLRDAKRSIVWRPPASGTTELLLTGWPDQPGEPVVTVIDVGGKRKPVISGAAA